MAEIEGTGAGFGRGAEQAAAAARAAAEATAQMAAEIAGYNDALREAEDLGASLAEQAQKTVSSKQQEKDLAKAILDSEKKKKEISKKIEEITAAIGKAEGDHKKELEKVKEKLEANRDSLDKGTKAAKSQLEISKKLNATFAKLGKAIMDGYVTALMNADQQIAETSRNLGLSTAEVRGLRAEFGAAADAANDIAVNATRLIEANNELNEQLGTAVAFNAETAGTFSKLTKITGIASDAAANLAFAAERSGRNFREVNEEVLGASYELQRQSGINLNNKKVLEAVGKVSGQLRANFAANPKAIAEAVTKAKLLGAEFEDIAAAGKQLLDFESSIENELQAELLTGKQLNLERARAAALAGDQATLADELAKNMGSFSEFSNMNVLQQDALAKSMGMSADQLADMLFKQETMGMNAKELRAMGKEELANQLEQRSLAENRQLAQEKFNNALADTAAALLPILELFGGIFETLFGFKPLLDGVVAAATVFAAIQGGILVKQTAINAKKKIEAALEARAAGAGIFKSFAQIPFGIGIPLAIGAIVALYSALNKSGETAKKMYQGGIVKPRAGGTPAIIGEAGQPEAVIPLNKAKQMGFGGGGGGSAQPIIIKNTFDAFAASNGNGRKGLGGTQEMQASPTFA